MADAVAPTAAAARTASSAFDDAVGAFPAVASPPLEAHDAPRLAPAPKTPTEQVEAEQRQDFPPSFVFAPGFMYADRRGLVPYPGLEMTTEALARFLARRSGAGHEAPATRAKVAYDEIARLGAR